MVTREWHNKKAGWKAAGMKTDAAIGSGLRYVLGVECFKTFFHASIVDTKELVGGSHHVDLVGFALGTFPVHELEDGLICWRGTQNNAHDQKQRSAQGRRAAFGDTAAVDVYRAGLVWRCVNTGKGYKSFLRMEPANVADLGHELRAEGLPDTIHLHDDGVFRQHLCKRGHALAENCQGR